MDSKRKKIEVNSSSVSYFACGLASTCSLLFINLTSEEPFCDRYNWNETPICTSTYVLIPVGLSYFF